MGIRIAEETLRDRLLERLGGDRLLETPGPEQRVSRSSSSGLTSDIYLINQAEFFLSKHSYSVPITSDFRTDHREGLTGL